MNTQRKEVVSNGKLFASNLNNRYYNPAVKNKVNVRSLRSYELSQIKMFELSGSIHLYT